MKKINYNKEDVRDHEAIGIVVKEKDKILMQEHVKYGFWTIPVGKIKPEQTLIEGLKEELIEECDIIPTKYKEIALKKYNYIRNKTKITVNIHLFEIIKYTGKIKNKESYKHKTQEFKSIETINKLPFLSDSTVLYLKTLGFKRKAKI